MYHIEIGSLHFLPLYITSSGCLEVLHRNSLSEALSSQMLKSSKAESPVKDKLIESWGRR